MLQTKTATTSAEHHQLVERLLSHLEAGPSPAEAQDPVLQTLRAQKLALSLLHRGIQLPSTLLNNIRLSDAPDQVKLASSGARRSTFCQQHDHRAVTVSAFGGFASHKPPRSYATALITPAVKLDVADVTLYGHRQLLCRTTQLCLIPARPVSSTVYLRSGRCRQKL